MDLLIGCGFDRTRKLSRGRAEWSGLITLDMTDRHKPDVVHDLESLPLPFPADSFDEIHAYDVLEHTGRQGDWRFFFDQWSDFWRLLKSGGYVMGISPHWSSPWAWGDPGHTRIVSQEGFTFLNQPAYAQVGRSPMTDYRFCYRADFDLVHCVVHDNRQMEFILQAVKPSRVTI